MDLTLSAKLAQNGTYYAPICAFISIVETVKTVPNNLFYFFF